MGMKKDKPVSLMDGSGGWLVVILLTSVLVIGLVTIKKTGEGWGWDASFLRKTFSGGDSGPDSGDRDASPTVSLPSVVVGLQGGGAGLYVDAAFDLEVASEQDQEAVRKQLSRVREETIGFLSELSPAELRGSDELAKMKARLLERYRNALPSQRLKALYLSYLAVARPEQAFRSDPSR